MASSTDLDGFLKNEDDNVEARLSAWLGKLSHKDLPARIRVSWRPDGVVSEENLLRGKDPDVIPITSLPATAPALVEQIRNVVVDRLGPSPAGGVLRVRASGKGQAASPDVDMSRKLVISGFGEDANQALLRAENDRLRSENAELRRNNTVLTETVVKGMGSMSVLVGEQAKQIGVLGATRAATAAADEMSGLTTILGMMSLFFFMPMIKSAMGLPEAASLREVINAGKKMMFGFDVPKAETQPASLPPLPPGSGPAPSAPPSALPQNPPDFKVDQVVDRLEDEDFRKELAKKIMGNPQLMIQLQQSYQEVA